MAVSNRPERIACAVGLLALTVLAITTSPYVLWARDQNDRVAAPAVTSDSLLPGFTAAYRHAVLATLQPGRLSRIMITEGQHVSEGQLLASLDSRVQAARTEIARLEAESTTEIELARVRMEHARVELDRLKRLSAATAAAGSETRQAQLVYETASLTHQQAQQAHAQAVEHHRLQQDLLAQYELRAPFSGVITEKLKEAGETVEALEGLLELSQLDLLLVTVDCPLALQGMAKVGDRIPVVPANGRAPMKVGEVTSSRPVADPSSQTFKLKLVVPNDDGSWVAGLLVNINLGDKLSGAAGEVAASQPAVSRAGF